MIVTIFMRSDVATRGDFLGRLDLADAERKYPGEVFIVGVPLNRRFRWNQQPLTGNKYQDNDHVIVHDLAEEQKAKDNKAAKQAKRDERQAARAALNRAAVEALVFPLTAAQVTVIKDTLLNLMKKDNLGS